MSEDTFEIPKTTSEDWLKWGSNPKETIDLVRANANNLGLDLPKYILGLMINTISSDDPTVFSLSLTDASTRGEIDLAVARESLIVRLSLEETLPELPDDLKDRIKIYKEQLESQPWEDKESVIYARKSWEETVKSFLDQQLADEFDYGLAQIYFEENEDRVQTETSKHIK